MSDNESLDIVLMSIGAVVAAVRGQGVSGLDSAGSVATVDLFQVLAQDPPAGTRRRLRVKGTPPWDLLVGASVRVQRRQVHELQPVPAYLHDSLGALGVIGLIHTDAGFALLLDPAVLAPESAL